LVYHLQLHMRACKASQWLHAQCFSSAADPMVNVSNVHYMYICMRK